MMLGAAPSIPLDGATQAPSVSDLYNSPEITVTPR